MTTNINGTLTIDRWSALKLSEHSSEEHENDMNNTGTVVLSKIETHLKEPSLYKIYLHNDDFTPMEFVVAILETVFHMDHVKANKIMLDVHHKGMGCCGLFPYQIAETKVAQVSDAAKENEYPLKCSMEKD